MNRRLNLKESKYQVSPVRMDTLLIQNWCYQLLGMIPESIAMVALGTALIKEKYTWKQISLTGLLIGIIGFILQQLPIKYGVHIPLGIMIFILILNLVLKLNILKSTTAAILSFIAVIVIEALMFILLVKVLGYSEEMLFEGSDLKRFLASLLPLCCLILFAGAAQVWFRSRLRLKEGCVK